MTSHYHNVSELAKFIDEELKEGPATKEFFYYHAVRKWGFGEKIVDKIINNGIAVQAYIIAADGRVAKRGKKQ